MVRPLLHVDRKCTLSSPAAAAATWQQRVCVLSAEKEERIGDRWAIQQVLLLADAYLRQLSVEQLFYFK